MESVLFIELFRNGFSHGTMPKSLEPAISTLTSFTVLKNRYHVDFIDLKIDMLDRNSFRKALTKRSYSSVFIEVKSYNRYFALDIIREVKTRTRARIFCFGQHVSIEPEFILDEFPESIIIRDEIYAFMKGFSEGKDPLSLPNAVYRKRKKTVMNKTEEVTDLDSLPDIDLNTLHKKRYFTIYPMKSVARQSWGFLALTKGCPHSCVFCSQTLRITHGKKIYHHSADDAVRRIIRLVDAGFRFIRFFDDDVLSDPLFMREVCARLIEKNIDVRWMAQARADSVDEKTLRLMKLAGCECLNIGVETGSEKIMKTLRKGETIQDIRNCFSLCKKHGLLTVAYFMVGNPGETHNDLRRSYALLRDIDPDMLQVAFFTPYPGTPYYQKMKSIDKKRTGFYHYDHIVSNFSMVSSQELISIRRRWYISFYLHPRRFWKLSIYRLRCLFFNPAREYHIIVNSIRYLSGF